MVIKAGNQGVGPGLTGFQYVMGGFRGVVAKGERRLGSAEAEGLGLNFLGNPVEALPRPRGAASPGPAPGIADRFRNIDQSGVTGERTVVSDAPQAIPNGFTVARHG